jgi:hypothetical protein
VQTMTPITLLLLLLLFGEVTAFSAQDASFF